MAQTDEGGIDIHLPSRLGWKSVIGLAAVVALSVGAYWHMNSRIGNLESGLLDLLAQLQADTAGLDARVTNDRQFHIEQRIRVWDRLDALDGEIQTLREATAGMRADIAGINMNIGRILNILESRRQDPAPQ